MVDATMLAQEFTDELLEWRQGKDPVAVVPALLVAAVKIAAASGRTEELERMISLLTVCFDEECEKYKAPLRSN